MSAKIETKFCEAPGEEVSKDIFTHAINGPPSAPSKRDVNVWLAKSLQKCRCKALW